jgi:hypothetical protein
MRPAFRHDNTNPICANTNFLQHISGLVPVYMGKILSGIKISVDLYPGFLRVCNVCGCWLNY